MAASVEISGMGANGRGVGGSGTCFAYEGGWAYVITCKHVADGKSGLRYSCIFPGARGSKVALTFVAADKYADLAILKFTSASQPPVVPIASRTPNKGDPLMQVGYPAPTKGIPGGLTKRTGYVRGYRDWKTTWHSQDMLVSFEVRSGDSGSGVFLTQEKALCGVIWGIVNNSDYSAVPWKDIARFSETCSILPPWRRRPQQPQPPPPQPQPVPPPFEQPPPPPAPSPSRAQEIIDRIKALEDRIKNLVPLQPNLGPLQDKIKSLEDTIKNLSPDLAGKLQGDLAKIKAQLDGLGLLSPHLNDIAQKLPIVMKVAGDAASGIGTLTPWLVAGSATGGLAPLIWVVSMLVRKKPIQAATSLIGGHLPGSVVPQVPQTQPQMQGLPANLQHDLATIKSVLGQLALNSAAPSRSAIAPPSAPAGTPAPINVTADASAMPMMAPHLPPVLPQQVLTQTQYLPFATNQTQQALDWAKSQITQRYPNMVTGLEVLDSLMQQHLAGQQAQPSK